MDFRFIPLDLARIDTLRAEVAVLPFFVDERPLRGAAGLCDWRLCGRLSRVLQRGRVEGALGEVTLVPGRPRLPFDKLLLVGCGAREDFDEAAHERVVLQLLRALEGLRLRSFAVSLPGRGAGVLGPAEAVRWFLRVLGDAPRFDEVMVLDEAESQRVMMPVVESERQRIVRAREALDDEGEQY
ncbi:MAG: leucyl aminopeptidase [Myxococcales bacterium]|nr:leucyl aminopeptidase [Myxococcales bacterium]